MNGHRICHFEISSMPWFVLLLWRALKGSDSNFKTRICNTKFSAITDTSVFFFIYFFHNRNLLKTKIRRSDIFLETFQWEALTKPTPTKLQIPSMYCLAKWEEPRSSQLCVVPKIYFVFSRLSIRWGGGVGTSKGQVKKVLTRSNHLKKKNLSSEKVKSWYC